MNTLSKPGDCRYPVAVYGTLRRGGRNHHFLKHAEFLGRGQSLEAYCMYIDYLPRLVPFVSRSSAQSPIVVELYRVDAPTLKALDRLEEHPNWYRRELCDFVLDGAEAHTETHTEAHTGNSPTTAWLYFYPPIESLSPRQQRVDRGDFARIAGALIE